MIDIELDRRGSVATSCGIGATELLQLISDCSLIDCWRSLHPSDIYFTWRNVSNTVSSRLDRFYVSSSLDVASCLNAPCHLSDHDGVILNFNCPEIVGVGEGFWKCNVSTLSDTYFRREFRNAYAGWRTLKEGFDNELLWWEDVKQRITTFISSYSRRLSRKRRRKRFFLQKSFNSVFKLNAGSSDPDLLLQHESIKKELEKLDGLKRRVHAFVREPVNSRKGRSRPSTFFGSNRHNRKLD